MTIGQLLKDYRGNMKNHKGSFGLEIETQSTHAYEPKQFTFWNVHRDESLRGPGPFEYVLKAPLNWGEQLDAALDEFKEKTSTVKWMTKDTWTTSVHVHINMMNENVVTFGNFLTTYCLLENLLVNFAGDDRQSNLFCLPIKDAQENHSTMMRLIHAIRDKRYQHFELNVNDHKYAGLNLASLYQLGSLECRLMGGTTDIERIKDWVGMFQKIVEFSRKDITPKDIVLAWKTQNIKLLSDIVGSKYKNLLSVNSKKEPIDVVSEIESNFWYGASIASLVKDWNALIEPEEDILPTEELLAKLAKSVYGAGSFEILNEDQKVDLYANYAMYAGRVKKGGKKKSIDPFDHAQQVANAAAGGLAGIINAAGAPQPVPQPVPQSWVTAPAPAHAGTMAAPVAQTMVEEFHDEEFPDDDDLGEPDED